MNQTQKEAWITLKTALDKYSQATGAEVAVVTKFYPITALTENYLPQDIVKAELAFHGHGTLYNQVKRALTPTEENWSKRKGGGSFENMFERRQDKPNYPFSSSYHTLRLDAEPQKKREPSHTNSSSNNSNDSFSTSIPLGGFGKKKSRKKRDRDGDIELDENLLFGEDEVTKKSDEDDSSDDDSSVENVGYLPRSRVYKQGGSSRSIAAGGTDQFATSLPVSINAGWGQQNDNPGRFRDNQGPRQPTYDQPISGAQSNVNEGVIQAEQTPHLDTIMASMQALARSVTDDTSLIFGERPRPRVYNESSAQRHAH